MNRTRHPPQDDLARTARDEMDRKVKPPGSLGLLEDWAVQLATLRGSVRPRLERPRVVIFAGDHGVSAAGVSAYPAAVTAAMLRTFSSGGAAVTVLCRNAGIEVEVVDVGVDEEPTPLPGVLRRGIRRGTRNLLEEEAMTEAELEAALEVGRERVRAAASEGVDALGLGEMGIGNTTSAAAMLGALTGAAPEVVVGRGTGVDDAGLARKLAVVRDALARHASAREAPRAALRSLGGLELAALAGACLEAHRRQVAVMVDGFPCTVAALAAVRMEPAVRGALFFSHRSAVPGHRVALAALEAHPALDAGLRLGEASGAALALPLLGRAADLLREMATFESAAVPGRSP